MTTPWRGGGEFAAVDLLNALAARGHDVVFLTNQPDLARGTQRRDVVDAMHAALAATLQERFAGAGSVEIRQADARLFDYAGLRAGAPDPAGRVLVVGNLPYSVGKPILAALVESGGAIDEMALMLQKEVAERIAAAPGSKVYGALSVLTQIDCNVTPAFTVSPGASRRRPRSSPR